MSHTHTKHENTLKLYIYKYITYYIYTHKYIHTCTYIYSFIRYYMYICTYAYNVFFFLENILSLVMNNYYNKADLP